MSNKLTFIEGAAEQRRLIVGAAMPGIGAAEVAWVADNFDVITEDLVFSWDSGLDTRTFRVGPYVVNVNGPLKTQFAFGDHLFGTDTVMVLHSIVRAGAVSHTAWFAWISDPEHRARRRAERLSLALTSGS
jgi:hypothetical protein